MAVFSVPTMLKLLVALPVAIFLASGANSYIAVNGLSSAIQPIIDEELPATVYESMMSGAYHKSLSNLLASNQIGLSHSEREARLKSAQESFNYFKARLESYSTLKKSETAMESFKLIQDQQAAMEKSFNEVMVVAHQLDDDPANSLKMTKLYETELRPVAKNVESALEELAGLHIFTIKMTQKSMESVKHSTRLQISLMMLLGGLAVIFLGVVIQRQTLQILSGLARRLESAFSEVASSSGELTSASQKLSSGSADAAQSIAMAAESLLEMDQMIGRTLNNTRESGSVSEASRKAANSGADAVRSVISGTDLIHDSSLRLFDLQEIFKEIQGQTREIDKIVFKTQILRFNAAIEAARAGKHGRGFDFVAAEIGELARTSLEASQQISQLIAQSSKRVDGIVEEIRERVNDGQSKARVLTASFSSVLENVSQVNQSLSHIMEASGEQATGIGKIAKTTDDLKILVMNNTTVSSQVAETSNRLNDQASRFQTELATLYSAIGQERKRKKSA